MKGYPDPHLTGSREILTVVYARHWGQGADSSAKGRVVVEAMVAGMLREIEELRNAAFPPK